MKEHNYSFPQKTNTIDSNTNCYSCEIGHLDSEKLVLKSPVERDIFIHELAFVELKTKRNLTINYLVGFLGLFFSFLGFFYEHYLFTIFIGLMFFLFSLFYKKFNYFVLIILRVPEKIFITFNQRKIDEIKKFIKEANQSIHQFSRN